MMRRALKGLVVLAVPVIAVTWIPLSAVGVDEDALQTRRSGRRYWLDQAGRDRGRELQQQRDVADYHRQQAERRRRSDDWWRRHQWEAPRPEPK